MRDRDRRKVSVSLEPEVHARFEAWRTSRSLPPATALNQMVEEVLAGSAPAVRGRAIGQDGPGEPSGRPRPPSPGVTPADGAVALPGDLVRELALVRRTAWWKRLVEDGKFEEELQAPARD